MGPSLAGREKMKTKFYKCNVCGKQVVAINDTEGVLMCCGQPMVEIETKDKEEFFLEKHMPVYYRKKDKVVVRVGSKFHPATKEHHIEWVSLLTNKGLQIKNAEPYEDPEVTFYVDEDEEIKEISSYCNIHSLYTYCPDNADDEDDCGCTLKY